MKRSALIDTGPLVLLAVGLFDIELIEKHKKTNNFGMYGKYVFAWLVDQLSSCEDVWVTSHVLAESSNHLDFSGNTDSKQLLGTLSDFIISKGVKESNISFAELVKNLNFSKLGVADTGVLMKSRRITSTYTSDMALHIKMGSIGCQSFNLTHVFEDFRLRKI